MCVADILSNLVFLSDWMQRTFFGDDAKQSITEIVKSIKSEMHLPFVSEHISALAKYVPFKTTYTMPVHM